MKKFCASILCFCILLSCAGCMQDPTPTEQTHTVQPTVTEPSEPEQTQETLPPQAGTISAMTSVSLPGVYEYQHVDTTLVFYQRSPNVSFIHQDAAVSQTVLLDLRRRIDASLQHAQALRNTACSDYGSGQNYFPYFYELDYTPTRLDQGVLSLYATASSFAGGIHPSTEPSSVTYDLVTGSALSLRDILIPEFNAGELCQLVLDGLIPYAADGALFPGYRDTVEAMFLENTLPETWYFSETGLVFYFMPYEIAPFASGVITVELPYASLGGIMADRYYPVETEDTGGTLQALYFHEADLSLFSRFAEVILDREGTPLLLHPTGLIRQVRIETGNYYGENSFLVDSTVFACDVLTAQDAIVLQHLPAGDLPQIRISYEANGETVYKYLGFSGLDGSVLLLD